jgi:hypothetical protein
MSRNFYKPGLCDIHEIQLKPLVTSYFCTKCDNEEQTPVCAAEFESVPSYGVTIGNNSAPLRITGNAIVATVPTVTVTNVGQALSSHPIDKVKNSLSQSLLQWKKPFIDVVNYDLTKDNIALSTNMDASGHYPWIPKIVGQKDFNIVEIYIIGNALTCHPIRKYDPSFDFMCFNSGLSANQLNSFIAGFDDVPGATIHDWNCLFAGADLRKLR